VRDPLLAEDLTQETFFRVLKSLERIEDDFNFPAWIHRIATNLCYDEMRRRKRGTAPQAEDGPRLRIAGVTDPEEVLSAIPSSVARELPEEALEMRELRREVWAVAAQLPANYRTVLSLRELQGLSYSGIAEAMGLSESAVETLLHRARRRFKLEYLYLAVVQADASDRCLAVADLLREFGLRALRRSQRATILAHAQSCPNCAPLLEQPAEGAAGDGAVERGESLA
jgi:RNA polymerase sigma factor (sigma-70 family)